MELLFKKHHFSQKFITLLTVLCKSASLALLALLLTATAESKAEPSDSELLLLSRLGSPSQVTLASGGQALMDVVVGQDASSRTRDAARDLADYLSRITGGEFRVVTGDGTSGLAVGSYKDFPVFNLEELINNLNPTQMDDHVVHTHGAGVYLIGASALASQHAVWTFLHEIGYRQFFPTETWEIIPEKPDLSVMMSSFESPDFYERGSPRQSAWSDRDQWGKWTIRNRNSSSYSISNNHTYNAIVRRNQEAFDANPDFRSGNKFRVSEPGLVELVVQDAINEFKDNPSRFSISMEPSDLSGWCQSQQELDFKPDGYPEYDGAHITDRVVWLANKVAEAVNQWSKEHGHGEKYVGIMAYHQHSEPPNIRVHPNIVVNVSTSYSAAGYTTTELMQAWKDQGTTQIGIRDYYDTFVWAQGMPRRGRGGSVPYIARAIPEFHAAGGRIMRANSTDAWYVNGLGFYLSTRLMWDVTLSEQVDEIVDEFLEMAFGEAKEPMREYWNMMARIDPLPRNRNDILARAYNHIRDALDLTSDPDIIERLYDLAIYMRYVELWYAFEAPSDPSERQTLAEDTFRHKYRMQSRMMSSVAHLYYHLERSRIPADIPGEARPGSLLVGRDLVDMAPWKCSRLFSEEEIHSFISNGIEQNEIVEINFDVVDFSEDLVPARDYLDLPEATRGTWGRNNGFIGRHQLFSWLEPNESLTLTATGGTISHLDQGNVRFQLWLPRHPHPDPIDVFEIPNDRQPHQVILTSTYAGLHSVIMNDGGGRTYLNSKPGTLLTIQTPQNFEREFSLYFFVPKGTKVVGGYVTRHCHVRFIDSHGKEREGWQDLENNAGYFVIDVEEGQDDAIWRVLSRRSASLRLMTVPPYLARHPEELLLPRELFYESEEQVVPAENHDELPEFFDLQQNYPNPFNPSTNITFAVPYQSHVRLDVYNVIGQRVSTLVNQEKTPGTYNVPFDATALASGVYLYRLHTDAYQKTRQMLLVR